MYVPGTGVVMSAAVYRRLVGKILASGGAVRSDGLKGRTPRPLVVVHSGKTTTAWLGYCLMRVSRSVSVAFFGGSSRGYWKARSMALSREMRCTRRVDG